MISVTRLNGKTITINAILIETIEETPDTVITLTTGKKIMVLEGASEVVHLVQNYLQTISSIRVSLKSTESEGSNGV